MITTKITDPWHHSQSWHAHGRKWQFTCNNFNAQYTIENSDRSIILKVPICDTIHHPSPQAWLDKWAKTREGKANLKPCTSQSQPSLFSDNVLSGQTPLPCSGHKVLRKPQHRPPHQERRNPQGNDQQVSPKKKLTSLPCDHNWFIPWTGPRFLGSPSIRCSKCAEKRPISADRDKEVIERTILVIEEAIQESSGEQLRYLEKRLDKIKTLGEIPITPKFKIGEKVYLKANGKEAIIKNIWKKRAKILIDDKQININISEITGKQLEIFLGENQSAKAPTISPKKEWTDWTWGDRGLIRAKYQNWQEIEVCSDRLIIKQWIQSLESIKQEYFDLAQKAKGARKKDLLEGVKEKEEQIKWCKDRLILLNLRLRSDSTPSEVEVLTSEEKDEDERFKSSQSKAKKPSGSLYKFIQNKKTKSGIKTYPKVEGDRDPNNPDHWFWAYCWEERGKRLGQWRTRKRSVSREKLSRVREAIDKKLSVEYILKLL